MKPLRSTLYCLSASPSGSAAHDKLGWPAKQSCQLPAAGLRHWELVMQVSSDSVYG